jgi:PKD repeat protein
LAVALVTGLLTVATAPANAAPAPTIAVTATELCARTKSELQASSRYVSLSARQKRSVDALADLNCAILGRITPRLNTNQKAGLIALYKAGIDGLARSGWVSSAQASILKALANQLDNLRPVAGITGPVTGTAGVPVAFSGAQSGDADGTVTGYTWSWGDGSPDSTGVSPSHTYANPGPYTVTLTVTDNKGSASEPVSQLINVAAPNAKPTAVITDPGPAAAGTEVEFDGSQSSDTDGVIVSYQWSWGDDTPDGTGVETVHTFATAGTYTVTLTVTDDGGGVSDPATWQLEVAEPNAPGPCSTVTLNDTSGELLASATFAPAPAPTVTDCSLLQVVPEPIAGFPAAAAADQISADGLFGAGSTAIPAAPLGYTRLAPTVRYATGFSTSMRMCFPVPTNSADFEELRFAYFDTTPTINRWVFLLTGLPGTDTVCMSRGLRSPNPASLSLFGHN